MVNYCKEVKVNVSGYTTELIGNQAVKKHISLAGYGVAILV